MTTSQNVTPAPLPSDVLGKLFCYLPLKDQGRVARVCRRWQEGMAKVGGDYGAIRQWRTLLAIRPEVIHLPLGDLSKIVKVCGDRVLIQNGPDLWVAHRNTGEAFQVDLRAAITQEELKAHPLLYHQGVGFADFVAPDRFVTVTESRVVALWQLFSNRVQCLSHLNVLEGQSLTDAGLLPYNRWWQNMVKLEGQRLWYKCQTTADLPGVSIHYRNMLIELDVPLRRHELPHPNFRHDFYNANGKLYFEYDRDLLTDWIVAYHCNAQGEKQERWRILSPFSMDVHSIEGKKISSIGIMAVNDQRIAVGWHDDAPGLSVVIFETATGRETFRFRERVIMQSRFIFDQSGFLFGDCFGLHDGTQLKIYHIPLKLCIGPFNLEPYSEPGKKLTIHSVEAPVEALGQEVQIALDSGSGVQFVKFHLSMPADPASVEKIRLSPPKQFPTSRREGFVHGLQTIYHFGKELFLFFYFRIRRWIRSFF